MVKPLLDKPPQLEKKATGRVTLTRKYELITPLFGGGVKAGEVDSKNPIRGTAVRGHLRFWWRATRGGQFGGDLSEMKKVEDAIWGASAKGEKGEKRPLAVQIAVQLDHAGTPDTPFIHQPNKNNVLKPVPNKQSVVPAYAAFPLQRSDEDIKAGKPPRTVQKGIRFTLDLSFAEKHRQDVEIALWAWETFGGIGARTRRGFGALHCLAQYENGIQKTSPCIATEIKASITQRLETITGKWPKGVPHLSPKSARNPFFEVVPVQGDAIVAWKLLIDGLQSFRQSREGNQYGPTHWPEANAVRSNARKPKSSKSPYLGDDVFPRAQLGLPILFHFPQEKTLEDATLTGITKERMASRLILRPLVCGSNQAFGLAICLTGPIVPDGGIALDGKPVTHEITQQDAANIVPLDGETSLIKAFFKYLREFTK